MSKTTTKRKSVKKSATKRVAPRKSAKVKDRFRLRTGKKQQVDTGFLRAMLAKHAAFLNVTNDSVEQWWLFPQLDMGSPMGEYFPPGPGHDPHDIRYEYLDVPLTTFPPTGTPSGSTWLGTNPMHTSLPGKGFVTGAVQNYATVSHKQTVDPGVYDLKQDGKFVGRLVVEPNGTQNTLQHWYLFKGSSAGTPNSAAYVAPGENHSPNVITYDRIANKPPAMTLLKSVIQTVQWNGPLQYEKDDFFFLGMTP